MTTEGKKERGLPARLLASLRANLIIAFTTVLYVSTLFGGLYTLENAYYLVEKWTVITDLLHNSSYMDNEEATRTSGVVSRYVQANFRRVSMGQAITPEESQRHNELLRAAADKLLASSPVITAMAVEDHNGEVIFEHRDNARVRLQHDLSNSLLTRSFERSFKRSFMDERTQESLGTMRIFVTTAKGNTKIEELTTRYRNYMILFFISVTLLYYALVRFNLRPLSRVIRSIQGREDGHSSIIHNPGSTLEKAFNQLARDATLTRFAQEMRDVIAGQGLSYSEPLFEFLPTLVRRLVDQPQTQVAVFSRMDERAPWQTEKVFGEEKMEEAFRECLVDELSRTGEGGSRVEWTPTFLAWKDQTGVPRSSFVDLLDSSFDRLRFFVIHLRTGDAQTSREFLEFFARLSEEIRYALGSVEEQRRLILQEKSKANISLSRNLGHDLTNIIATSKLELMTIKTFLALPAGEVAHSPAKAQLFRESLEALLNNTRFLQEIVNLYRSFSYLQKPKFEVSDVNTIVLDVVQLYKLSLSRSFEIDTTLAKKIPPVRVEPRLLRLALFNLLTNSTDAIKKVGSEKNRKGRIHVTSEVNRKRGYVEIRVEDNGPGIRDGQGRLMEPEDIQEIFRLGYTTKNAQEGEGLGLNWVQNIVREFHHGEIIARNIKNGGAMFAIRIPLEGEESGDQVPSGAGAESLKPAMAASEKG